MTAVHICNVASLRTVADALERSVESQDMDAQQIVDLYVLTLRIERLLCRLGRVAEFEDEMRRMR